MDVWGTTSDEFKAVRARPAMSPALPDQDVKSDTGAVSNPELSGKNTNYET
jgi:hypothetical protein